MTETVITMMYGIPSATYREGTQAHGFRDVGLCVDMPSYYWDIGKMEYWNIDTFDGVKSAAQYQP